MKREMNVRGLSKPEEFEEIVDNDFIVPHSLINIDEQDINRFCSQQGVFDALRIESSRASFGDDLLNGVKRLLAAHDGQKVYSIMFLFTSKERDGYTLEMMNPVNEAFSLLEDPYATWGIALNPAGMKAEYGMYILANFRNK